MTRDEISRLIEEKQLTLKWTRARDARVRLAGRIKELQDLLELDDGSTRDTGQAGEPRIVPSAAHCANQARVRGANGPAAHLQS